MVVITTSRGEQDIQQQLLTPLEAWGGQTVWAKLREDIFAGARLPKENLRLQLSPRVIDLPDAATGVRQKADDLRTHAQNDAAANFIVQTLAPYCDAQDHQSSPASQADAKRWERCSTAL
ncbi:CRISPR-associated ring nuclease Csm6 [Verrucomicrobium spinosum]|uniref:CRISPR-associated ring nuclease Csm6 n=1 Tax=Verrucomicrobium spinosum TaxID=2736 RepID=UPI0009468022